MARKATWQSHADPRSAPTWRDIYYIFIYLSYINGSLSFPIWEGSYPYRSSGIINPTIAYLFLRVGLNPTLYLPCRRRGATTGVRSRRRAIDRRRSRERRTTDQGSTHVCKTVINLVGLAATCQHLMARSNEDVVHRRSKNTCLKSRIITVQIARDQTHPKR